MDQQKYCLYCHLFPNGKRYIGITGQNPKDRWANGLGYSKCNQPIMYNAIQKYGWDNIQHLIIFDNLNEEDALKLEVEFIAKYRSNDIRYGYNRTAGGAGTNGMHHTNATKAKISKASTVMWKNEEYRAKLSKLRSGQNNPNFGKSMSDEQRRILSECAKRRTGSSNPFYGKSHSKETKEKISNTKRGKYVGKENHNSKSVLCIETNTIFESASLAAKWVGASVSTITNACRHGADFLSYGYHWCYI